MRQQGRDMGAVIIKDISPGPAAMDRNSGKQDPYHGGAELTARWGMLISQETGIFYDAAILKDDGRPLYPEYIIKKTQDIME